MRVSKRQTFQDSFKQDALALLEKTDRGLAEVARDLGNNNRVHDAHCRDGDRISSVEAFEREHRTQRLAVLGPRCLHVVCVADSHTAIVSRQVRGRKISARAVRHDRPRPTTLRLRHSWWLQQRVDLRIERSGDLRHREDGQILEAVFDALVVRERRTYALRHVRLCEASFSA